MIMGANRRPFDIKAFRVLQYEVAYHTLLQGHGVYHEDEQGVHKEFDLHEVQYSQLSKQQWFFEFLFALSFSGVCIVVKYRIGYNAGVVNPLIALFFQIK